MISRNPGGRRIRRPKSFAAQGEIKRVRVSNVRMSAKTRRERGERPQSQATRIDGQSVRVLRESREIPAIAGFGGRARLIESRRKRGILCANGTRVRRPGWPFA